MKQIVGSQDAMPRGVAGQSPRLSIKPIKNSRRLLLLAPFLILAACSPSLKITAGYGHTCAKLGDGSIKCWGGNDYGQLGLGDMQNRGDEPGEMGVNLPTVNLGTDRRVQKIVPWQLAAGDYHTCATLNNLTVKCWGSNHRGQLGLGDTNSRGDQPGEMGNNLPAVDLGTTENGERFIAVEIVAGSNHTCVRSNMEDVKCWGENFFGQLGLGDRNNRGDNANEMGNNLPIVDLGTDRNGRKLTAVALAAEENGTCAALSNGKVKCWGYGTGAGPGEMGDNLPAIELGTGTIVVGLTSGRYHTCAHLKTGSVKCWGQNTAGQLGLGNTAPYEAGDILPTVNIGTGKIAADIVAGHYHTCARVNYGAIKCWGANGAGQLGQGDTKNRGDGPGEMGDQLLPINFGSRISSDGLAAGADHTCAYLTDETIKCWGKNNFGQLGQGDSLNRGDGPNEMGDFLVPIDLGQ